MTTKTSEKWRNVYVLGPSAWDQRLVEDEPYFVWTLQHLKHIPLKITRIIMKLSKDHSKGEDSSGQGGLADIYQAIALFKDKTPVWFA